jgi:hypothetical protein
MSIQNLGVVSHISWILAANAVCVSEGCTSKLIGCNRVGSFEERYVAEVAAAAGRGNFHIMISVISRTYFTWIVT